MTIEIFMKMGPLRRVAFVRTGPVCVYMLRGGRCPRAWRSGAGAPRGSPAVPAIGVHAHARKDIASVVGWMHAKCSWRTARLAFGSNYSNGYSRAASSRNSTRLPPARSVAPVPSTSRDRTRTLAHQRTNICFNRQSIRAPARCSVGRSMRTAFQRLGVENQIRRKLAAVLQMLVVERP